MSYVSTRVQRKQSFSMILSKPSERRISQRPRARTTDVRNATTVSDKVGTVLRELELHALG